MTTPANSSNVRKTEQLQQPSTSSAAQSKRSFWGHFTRNLGRLAKVWKKNRSSLNEDEVQIGEKNHLDNVEPTKEAYEKAQEELVEDQHKFEEVPHALEAKPEKPAAKPLPVTPADIAFRNKVRSDIEALKEKLASAEQNQADLEKQRKTPQGRDALALMTNLTKSADTVTALRKELAELQAKLNYIEFKIAAPPPFQTTSITFEELAKKSQTFQQKVPLPTTDNQITRLGPKAKIEEQANQARPIIDARVWVLGCRYLEYKKAHGSLEEKNLYENMTPREFFDRLLTKRPLMFMGTNDATVDREGKKRNYADLPLSEYISYDEMRISAYLSTSTPTLFINNGDKANEGVKDPTGNFQGEGVFYGVVGARFEKPGAMEDQFAMIRRDQQRNPEEMKLWEDFFQVNLPSFDSVDPSSSRYVKIDQNTYFDKEVYKAALKPRIEAFLVDSNERAKASGIPAFVHASGIGLGAWKPEGVDASLLGRIQQEIYYEVIQQNHLDHIGTLNFSYFPSATEKPIRLGDHTVEVRSNQRKVAEKLDKEQLLCAMYAWDSNSFPGNEFWGHQHFKNMLSASMDPAAACCSTIGELQNPSINPNISGANMRVYSGVNQEQKGKWDREARAHYLESNRPQNHQVSLEHEPSKVEHLAQTQLHVELEELKDEFANLLTQTETVPEFDWLFEEAPAPEVRKASPEPLPESPLTPEMEALTKKVKNLKHAQRISFAASKSVKPREVLEQVFTLSKEEEIPVSFLIDEMKRMKGSIPPKYKDAFKLLNQYLKAKQAFIESDEYLKKAEEYHLENKISFEEAERATNDQALKRRAYENLQARVQALVTAKESGS